MPASYPDSVKTFREKQNRPGYKYDEARKTNVFAEDFQQLEAEVVAIEEALGPDIAGGYYNLAERLENFSGGGGVPYTGATDDVYLGAHNFQANSININHIDLIDAGEAATAESPESIVRLDDQSCGTDDNNGPFFSGFTKNGNVLFGIASALASTSVFWGGVIGEAWRRFRITTGGWLMWGSGSAAPDVYLKRTADHKLTLSRYSNDTGAADLEVIGELTAANLTNTNTGDQTITGNMPGVNRTLPILIIDPPTVYGKTPICPFFNQTDAALHIKRIRMNCNANPATEPTGDIKYADNIIGLANATVILAFDTANGEFDSGAIDISVPAGKCAYISYDTSPLASTFHLFQITYSFD